MGRSPSVYVRSKTKIVIWVHHDLLLRQRHTNTREAAMYPPFPLLLLYFPLHYAGDREREEAFFGLMRTLNRGGGGWHHRRLRPHARSPEKRLSKRRRRRRRGGGRIWEGALCKKGRRRYDAEATKEQGMDVNGISLGGIIHHVTHIVSPGKS